MVVSRSTESGAMQSGGDPFAASLVTRPGKRSRLTEASEALRSAYQRYADHLE